MVKRATAERTLRSEGKHRQYIKNKFIDFLIFVFVVVSVVSLLQTFVICTAEVDGQSMAPALLEKERLLVDLISVRFVRPRRADIIVVDHPAFKEHLVKRVIGLPGEEIAIHSGAVYIDGKKLYEGRYWNGEIDQEMDPVIIPEDAVFVIGDNRNHSTDSRHPSVGPVPRKSIVGYARLVIWPLDQLRFL